MGHSGIGTLPIVFFGHGKTKKKYLPLLATGEKLAAYCLSEPQAGADAQNSRHARRCFHRTGARYPERAKDVDHERRIPDVYIVFRESDGENFSCFIVERAFRDFHCAEEKKMASKGSSTTALFSKIASCPRKIYCTTLAGAHTSRSTS